MGSIEGYDGFARDMNKSSNSRLLMRLAPLCLTLGCKPPHPTISLHDAIQSRNINQVDSNLHWGCDVNARSGDRGMTSVQLASLVGDERIARLVVERGSARYEPWDALYGNDFGTIKYLLDRKPLDQGQAYSLYAAAIKHGSVEGVRYLASKGVDARVRDRLDLMGFGETRSGLMHEFVRASVYKVANDDLYTRLFNELLKASADMNAIDYSGQTPLGLAVDLNNSLAERLLRSKGALKKGNRYIEESQARFQAEQAEFQKELDKASRHDAERFAEEERLRVQEELQRPIQMEERAKQTEAFLDQLESQRIP
ncbi:MAG: hypothetical protein EON58_04335 [Alphaproteobacteria bacterium]|nr:MAG: hypothetical protein EON58_04335 [Alphaproteobacteria bacterium]